MERYRVTANPIVDNKNGKMHVWRIVDSYYDEYIPLLKDVDCNIIGGWSLSCAQRIVKNLNDGIL